MDKEGDVGHYELPALKLAGLLSYRDDESGGMQGENGANKSKMKVEGSVHAALISEVVDGRTVVCVPLTTCSGLELRLDEEEAMKVPSVTLSLKVPSKTYVDLESCPQSKMGYVVRGGRDLEGRQFRLAWIDVPKTKLDDASVAHAGPVPSARSYGSEHLDTLGEPLGVAAAASLADLVLGRVVLLHLLWTDEDGTWVGDVLMPAVCDTRVDGTEEAEKLYRSLANKTFFRGKALHILSEEPRTGLSGWEQLVTLVRSLVLKKGYSFLDEVLGYFTGAVFDYSSCPPLMAVFDVSEVMVRRGLSWVVMEVGLRGADGAAEETNGKCRWQHLLAVQERAREHRKGIWQLCQGRLHKLRVDMGGDLPRFSGECSAFPALLFAQLLKHLSDEEEGSEARRAGGRFFFAALVTKVIDGDSVRLVPVLSDEHVRRHLFENDRCSLKKLEWVVHISTTVIIGAPYYPKVELESWCEGDRSDVRKDTDKRSILTQVYGIDTPEVARGGVKPYNGRTVLQSGARHVYGSEHLDRGGQPLGVAAARAMAELVLGRVVLVEELGSCKRKRLVGRLLVPAVSDKLHADAASYAAYFKNIHTEVRCAFLEGFGSASELPKATGAHGVAEIVAKIRKAKKGNLQGVLLACLERVRFNGIAGLVDPSEEMVRRGLATLRRGENVNYGGELQKKKLEGLVRTAKKERCGRWGLPKWCQEDPQDFRRRKGYNKPSQGEKARQARREHCRRILLGDDTEEEGNLKSPSV